MIAKVLRFAGAFILWSALAGLHSEHHGQVMDGCAWILLAVTPIAFMAAAWLDEGKS